MNTQEFSSGGGYTIGEAILDESNVAGSGGPANPRLFIPVKIKFYPIHTPGVDYVFTGLDARLCHDKLGVIADALSVRLQRIQRFHWQHPAEESVSFEFPLDTRRVDFFEKARGGKDLPLSLDLALAGQEHGVIEADEKSKRPALWGLRSILRLTAHFSFTVPRSVWIERVLPQVGYGIIQLVEMPLVPIAACDGLKHSFEALRQAQSLHVQGHYDEAVLKCRVALDQFFDYVLLDPLNKDSRKIPELKKSWETRLGKATYDWLNSTLGAIKDAANPTAHSPNRHFDQFESQMIQAMTTTLVAYAARAQEAEAKA